MLGPGGKTQMIVPPWLVVFFAFRPHIEEQLTPFCPDSYENELVRTDFFAESRTKPELLHLTCHDERDEDPLGLASAVREERR
jgi:hypothetical protein